MLVVTQNIPKIRAQIFSRSSAHVHYRANINSVLISMSDSEFPHNPPVGKLFALNQVHWCLQLQLHIPLSLNIN